MSSSTTHSTETHHRSGRRPHKANQDDAEASLRERHRSRSRSVSTSRSASKSRRESKAEEPRLPKKEPAAPKSKKGSTAKEKFAKGFAALDLYPEEPKLPRKESVMPKPKKDTKAKRKLAQRFAALDLYPEAQRLCYVCGDEHPESNSYDMGCVDRHWSCVDCLKAAFEAYFKDFKNPPRCCKQPLNFYEVANTVFLKEKHRDFVERGLQRMADLSKMMAEKKHNFHCAWPDCGTPLKKMGQSGKKKFGVCSKCEKKTCETCKSPWPRGHSSEKCHNAGDTEVEVLAKSLKLKSTTCPHCGISNVKTEGCNLVLCPCQGLYCYECDEKVTPGKPLCEHIGRR